MSCQVPPCFVICNIFVYFSTARQDTFFVKIDLQKISKNRRCFLVKGYTAVSGEILNLANFLNFPPEKKH